MSEVKRPLEGVKVLELATFIARSEEHTLNSSH